MTEQATNTRGLPQRLYLKSGRYYYVKRGPKGNLVWTGLSRNLSEALEQHRLLEAGKAVEAFEQYDAPAHWLGEVSKSLHAQAKRRAVEADILFALTVDDVVAMGMATNWRCAVTGVKFSRDKHGEAAVRPFMPSIDRIKSSGAYTAGNCRLVCSAANFAMNEWGQGVLHELAVSYCRHHGLMRPVRSSNGKASDAVVTSPVAREEDAANQ